MSAEHVNPYQSPLAISEPVRNGKPKRAWLPLALVVVAACAYFAFTGLLLMSPGKDDRNGGLVFLLNTPVFVIWVVGLVRIDDRSSLVGFAAVGMQLVITGIMIVTGIGDIGEVCKINGAIALILSLLAGICWIFTRRNAAPQSRGERET